MCCSPRLRRRPSALSIFWRRVCRASIRSRRRWRCWRRWRCCGLAGRCCGCSLWRRSPAPCSDEHPSHPVTRKRNVGALQPPRASDRPDPRDGKVMPMNRGIDYGNLMHDAMRRLIQQVLEKVANAGLPGAHHFFITFDTMHPDVEIADWLSDRYPEEMTIVIQHWFDNLQVTEDGFSITLNFGNQPEPLYIPYDAIKTF